MKNQGYHGETYTDNGSSFHIDHCNDRETVVRVDAVYMDDHKDEKIGVWIDTDIYDADAPLLLLSKETWDALVNHVRRKFDGC